MIVTTGTPGGLASPTILFGNVLEEGTLTASSTAAGHYPENALGPQTGDWWVAGAMPATLTVVLPGAETCDCCGVVDHTLGSMGATVEVQRWTGTAWVTVAAASPSDDGALLLIWPEVAATRWQLLVSGAAAPAIGVAMIGKRLLIPAAVQPEYVEAVDANRVELMTNRTLGGHFAGSSVFRLGLENDVAFTPVPTTWVRGDLQPFRRHYDNGGTFFFAGGPEAMPDDVAYCWRPEGGTEMRPARAAGGYWSRLSMRLAGYGA